MSYVEPWLRETPVTLDPLLHGLGCSLTMAEEEVTAATAELSEEQIWASPQGLTPIGYHLQHLRGSLDRLLTYAQGHELSEAQLHDLAAEGREEIPASELLVGLREQLRKARELLGGIDPATFADKCWVGRKRIPVPRGSLLLHIAEHTQRHVGQVVTTAKLFHAG